jgi:hypothetical protein
VVTPNLLNTGTFEIIFVDLSSNYIGLQSVLTFNFLGGGLVANFRLTNNSSNVINLVSFLGFLPLLYVALNPGDSVIITPPGPGANNNLNGLFQISLDYIDSTLTSSTVTVRQYS